MNAVPADHSLAILSVLDYFHRSSVNACFHISLYAHLFNRSPAKVTYVKGLVLYSFLWCGSRCSSKQIPRYCFVLDDDNDNTKDLRNECVMLED
jgi:hypothetical protein